MSIENSQYGFDDMLAVTDLTKVYREGDREVHAVRDVSFTAGHGEFVAIVGPSGSGKTTTLAMLGGLLTPTRGSILLNGREVTGLSPRQLTEYRRVSVGYVFQANNLLPFLTARENLMVMCSIGACKGNGRERSNRLIEELGLSQRADALATQLSGGERQRVAIGRALMNDPEIVLVDEPTANLDSVRGRQVVEMLVRETKERNKLAIMVTHDLAMASLADHIYEMHDGVLTPSTASPVP
ncbi:MAG: ABC transporter ATP-binding protein [Thermomicrobiales bacterium]